MIIEKYNENHVSDNFTLSTILQNMSIEYNRQFRVLQRFAENMTIKSKQKIAFTARIPGDLSLISSQIVKFTSVITNEGEGLNVSDGVFYCPEPGLYYVFVSIMVSSKSAYIRTFKNNDMIMFVRTNAGNSNLNVGSNAVIIQLDKDDKLFVKSGGTFMLFRYESFFTGFKI
ncbi:hypothetical protein KUTeg_024318 [Tegillarca granosa]|uniref:C1q domain-containing protein n=1 Tax=Tegillarca granosa TaxID=220873 RepID=A0ABQ9DXQ3_TEGGR|nr:hypothetical protein KUTeg_024318 [Tegillarca granosa]